MHLQKGFLQASQKSCFTFRQLDLGTNINAPFPLCEVNARTLMLRGVAATRLCLYSCAFPSKNVSQTIMCRVMNSKEIKGFETSVGLLTQNCFCIMCTCSFFPSFEVNYFLCSFVSVVRVLLCLQCIMPSTWRISHLWN